MDRFETEQRDVEASRNAAIALLVVTTAGLIGALAILWSQWERVAETLGVT